MAKGEVLGVSISLGTQFDDKVTINKKPRINGTVFISGVGELKIDMELADATLEAIKKQTLQAVNRKLGLTKDEVK